ncbi:MAG: VCBS repeat-containing protein [Sedimentisphaerales bacterium]|nr:VCBS repeat-containing protein [Sedimentisphaerales bacterium]
MRKTWKTLIVLISLVLSPTWVIAEELDWIGSNSYRMIVSIAPGRSLWKTTPVDVEMNLERIEKEINVPSADFNTDSIRVVAYNANGHARVHNSQKKGEERFYIPHRLIANDLTNQWRISWRTDIRDVGTFAIYFSESGSGPARATEEIPVVGNGDFLSFGRTGVVGPFSGGYNEIVAAADADQDGDQDVFVAYSGTPEKGGIFYFENIQNESNLCFRPGQKIYPLKKEFQPIDWDGDGRIELLIGKKIYNLIQREGRLQLKDAGVLPKYGRADGIYIDWDGDGDRDLLSVRRLSREYYPSSSVWDRTCPPYSPLGVWLGENSRSGIVFHKNIGSAKNPAYAPAVAIEADRAPIETYGSLHLTAGDWDGDGDVDVMAGNSFQLLYFERKKAGLAQGVPLTTAKGDSPFSIYVRPYLADMDGDGDLDILMGNEDGRPTWFEHLAGGTLSEERFLLQQDAVIDVGCLSVPAACDWDHDGDFDLLVGNSTGFVEYFENISGKADGFSYAPGKRLQADGKEIRILAGNAGSIQGPDEAKYGYTMPEVADWDEDGILDLLLSDVKGENSFYENVGNKTNPRLAAGRSMLVDWSGEPPKPSWVWWKPGPSELVTPWRCQPTVVDWNDDGLNDYITVDHEGYLACFEGFLRNGKKWTKPGQRVFRTENGEVIRLSEMTGGQGGRARVCIADWDGNGHLDIIYNAHHLFGPTEALLKKVTNAGWYANIGGDGHAIFQWRGELIKKKIAINGEHSTTPEVIDLDGDGRLDLFLGGEDGKIECYHRAFIEDDLPSVKILRIEKRND